MYVNVPDVVSYAQRELISKIEKREYTSFCTSCGLTLSQSHSLYQSVIGKKNLTFGQIFSMRSFIPPCQWYYDESEELPVLIPFKVKITDTEKKGKEMSIAAKKETVALSWFRILREKKLFHAFCVLHSIEQRKINYMVFRTRYSQGDYLYVCRPNYKLIRSLRDIIHPDLWYIYPEELKEKIEIPYDKLIGTG
jgi:hypothetical protein